MRTMSARRRWFIGCVVGITLYSALKIGEVQLVRERGLPHPLVLSAAVQSPQNEHAQRQRFRSSLFRSELAAVAAAPWALVGIAIALILGCQEPRRRR